MAKKVTRKDSRLADDIRESLCEASDYFSVKTTKAIVHRVNPKKRLKGLKSAATSSVAKG